MEYHLRALASQKLVLYCRQTVFIPQPVWFDGVPLEGVNLPKLALYCRQTVLIPHPVWFDGVLFAGFSLPKLALY